MTSKHAKNCFSCDIHFNPIRRKNHCRYCGLVFCSKCITTPHKARNCHALEKACKKCLKLLQKDPSHRRPRESLHLSPIRRSCQRFESQWSGADSPLSLPED